MACMSSGKGKLIIVSFNSSTNPETYANAVLERDNVAVTPEQSSQFREPFAEWVIDNKYFNAKVDVYCWPLNHHSQVVKHFEDTNVDSILLVFSSSGLSLGNKKDIMEKWMDCVCQMDIDIRLMLNIDENDESSDALKEEMWQISLDNNFELIHSFEDVHADDEDDDEGYTEKIGMPRVKEALQSHLWPNHTMKETTKPRPPVKKSDSQSEDTTTEEGQEPSAERAADNPRSKESFEELFSKLQLMKEQAKNLPPEERKVYAEEMAMAFYDAIEQEEHPAS